MTKKALSVAGWAVAALAASTISASATLIDFTDSTTPLSVAGVYSVSGTPENPVPGDSVSGTPTFMDGTMLVGDFDGLGIRDDEISNPGNTSAVDQFVTITFDDLVRVTNVYFLDMFADPNGQTAERGFVNVGVAPDAVGAAAVTGTQTSGNGEAFITTSLVGNSFTIWAGSTNDGAGVADAALAAIKIAPVPLPASALLLLGAIGGLGVMRRRTRDAA